MPPPAFGGSACNASLSASRRVLVMSVPLSRSCSMGDAGRPCKRAYACRRCLHNVLHLCTPVISGDALAASRTFRMMPAYSTTHRGLLRDLSLVNMYSGPYRLMRPHSFSSVRCGTWGNTSASFRDHFRVGDVAPVQRDMLKK